MNRIQVLVNGALVSCVFILASEPALAQERHALIIGNSHYQHAVVLQNPRYDAQDMARTLKKLFFEVELVEDATLLSMEQAVDKYLANLKKKGGVGLFYYAGHGVQFNGDNYLLPVEIDVGTDAHIKSNSFNVAKLLDKVRQIRSDTNIIILDACRSNPFVQNPSSGGRSATSKDDGRGLKRVAPKIDTGLSKLDSPPNTLIAFATAPGRVASDGRGRNSPYTKALMNAMQETGLTIAEVFRKVRKNVVAKTNNQQVPWESSSLIEDFYFKPREEIPIGF